MLKRVSQAQRQAFRQLLRDLRNERGLLQVDLARKLGRRQNFVSLYERGMRRLDILELREVCKALGISLGAFVKRLEQRL